MPRQLLPMAYWQDCYVDITRPDVVYEQNSTTGRYVLPYIIDEESIDVDYEDELVTAERLLSAAGSPNAHSRNSGTRYPS